MSHTVNEEVKQVEHKSAAVPVDSTKRIFSLSRGTRTRHTRSLS